MYVLCMYAVLIRVSVRRCHCVVSSSDELLPLPPLLPPATTASSVGWGDNAGATLAAPPPCSPPSSYPCFSSGGETSSATGTANLSKLTTSTPLPGRMPSGLGVLCVSYLPGVMTKGECSVSSMQQRSSSGQKRAASSIVLITCTQQREEITSPSNAPYGNVVRHETKVLAGRAAGERQRFMRCRVRQPHELVGAQLVAWAQRSAHVLKITERPNGRRRAGAHTRVPETRRARNIGRHEDAAHKVARRRAVITVHATSPCNCHRLLVRIAWCPMRTTCAVVFPSTGHRCQVPTLHMQALAPLRRAIRFDD